PLISARITSRTCCGSGTGERAGSAGGGVGRGGSAAVVCSAVWVASTAALTVACRLDSACWVAATPAETVAATSTVGWFSPPQANIKSINAMAKAALFEGGFQCFEQVIV